MSDFLDWIAPVLSFVAVIGAALLAYKGSKDTDSTDRLSKAAGLYSDYADKMEKRVAAVEKKNEELETNQDEMNDRLERSEKDAEIYKKEAGDYRQLILEVIQWITELIDWELREYAGPQPRVTLNMVLTHLTNFMKSRNFDTPDEASRGENDADRRSSKTT